MVITSKEQFDKVPKPYEVPKVVWCYWAGPKMTGDRRLSFDLLVKNIGVTVCLIGPDNVNEFCPEGKSLHAAFPYLSSVHQSDYIRAFLWHHYGGSWHDVKATEVDISGIWELFEDPSLYLVGMAEVKNGPAKVFDLDGNWMPDKWEDLVSVISWVGRPNTQFSKEVLIGMEQFLDENISRLIRFPAIHPREKRVDAKGKIPQIIEKIKYKIEGRNYNYPIPWTFFGNIFHPLNYKFKNNINKSLPYDKVKNAGVNHRKKNIFG